MRLYRYRLDMRACHPAKKLDRLTPLGVTMPHGRDSPHRINGYGETIGGEQWLDVQLAFRANPTRVSVTIQAGEPSLTDKLS